MKKIISLMLVLVMLAAVLSGCGGNKERNVGICQLMVHDSLDQAAQGFIDALNAGAEKTGKTVSSIRNC